MSSLSERSSSYSSQSWIEDAAIVKVVWNLVFENNEFPSLKEDLQESDKTEVQAALADLDPEYQNRLTVSAKGKIHKIRKSTSTVEDLKTILVRFRNGPDSTNPAPEITKPAEFAYPLKEGDLRVRNVEDFTGLRFSI
jgi:hypothetical protein